jgi:hypothetical protein
MLSGGRIEVIRFKSAAFQASELFPLVTKGLTCFAERYTADASWPLHSFLTGWLCGFIFDIHDLSGQHEFTSA